MGKPYFACRCLRDSDRSFISSYSGDYYDRRNSRNWDCARFDRRWKAELFLGGEDVPSKRNGIVDPLHVYTDGCCFNNGYRNAYGGIGVWFDDDNYTDVAAPLYGDIQTSQRAELVAIQRALEEVNQSVRIRIYTDSKYAIDCITKWRHKWEDNGYVNARGYEVANADVIQCIAEILDERECIADNEGFWWREEGGVEFRYVPAHSGIYGNECADELARKGANKSNDDDEYEQKFCSDSDYYSDDSSYPVSSLLLLEQLLSPVNFYL